MRRAFRRDLPRGEARRQLRAQKIAICSPWDLLPDQRWGDSLRIGLLWHEASTEEAVIYLGADLSCRQNATHSRDIDWLLNYPLGRPCP